MAYEEFKAKDLRRDIKDAYELAAHLLESYADSDDQYAKLRLSAVCEDLQDAIRNLDLAEKELENK